MPKKKKVEEDEDEGFSLDDAFADDDDVEYAAPAPPKKKKAAVNEKKTSTAKGGGSIKIDASKPIADIKKGDIVTIDGLKLEVDAHLVMIDHGGGTKEMAIECFDPKKDVDYQLRYFSDQVETSLEVYEMVEIMYSKKDVKKISW